MANRAELLGDRSAVPSGTAVTVTRYPNGTWATSGSVTFGLAKGQGTFNPASVPLSGGTAPVTTQYTPSAVGEHMITSSAPGLFPHYGAPLNVFAATGGAAQALGATLALGDWSVHQYDAPVGTPTGFDAAVFTKGWAEVWVTLDRAVPALFVQLRDALSSGATTTALTGTALSGVVQVSGPAPAGEVRLLLPVSRGVYFGDLATDAAFTSPVRLANRFRCGLVIGMQSRSQKTGRARSFDSTNVATGNAFTKASTFLSYDGRYPPNGLVNWYQHDNVTQDPYGGHYSETSSSGTQEQCRLVEQQLGMACGIVGVAASTGGTDTMVAHDGSLIGGLVDTVNAATRKKMRIFLPCHGGWDNADSNYPESFAEYRTRMLALPTWVGNNLSCVAIIGYASGASGVFGQDGSRNEGYTRLACVTINELEPVNPMVVSLEEYAWNAFKNGHATMAARVQYVRSDTRLLLAAELAVMGGFGTSLRGPTLAAAATLASGSRVVRFPFKLNGGTALKQVGVNCTSDSAFNYDVASNTELAFLFAIYAGSSGRAGNGQAIKVATAAVNTMSPPTGYDGTVDVTLAGASGVTYADGSTGALPAAMTGHYAADFGASNGIIGGGSGRGVVLCDDRTDLFTGMGWHMRPKVDIAIQVTA